MSSPLTTWDLTTLYCVIDEATKEITKQPIKLGRPSLLSDSELTAILVYNTLFLRQKNLKDVWKFINLYHQADFPRFPSYPAFVAHSQRILPLMCSILSQLLTSAPITFVDSTMLEVCKLYRADSHKVTENIATFGKNHQGWHYGFKLHAVIDAQGHFSSFCFSGAEKYDPQMLPWLVKPGMKIMVGDSLYGASVMKKFIYNQTGIIIIAPPHWKQRTKLATNWQNTLLSIRSKIESVFDVLKEHFHLVTSFPRSIKGYFVHYLRVLLAYQFSLLINSLDYTKF